MSIIKPNKCSQILPVEINASKIFPRQGRSLSGWADFLDTTASTEKNKDEV